MSESIDATKDNGRMGRLINHSKLAHNLVPKLVENDGRPTICFFAARDIRKHEELLYNYGDRNKSTIAIHSWLKA